MCGSARVHGRARSSSARGDRHGHGGSGVASRIRGTGGGGDGEIRASDARLVCVVDDDAAVAKVGADAGKCRGVVVDIAAPASLLAKRERKNMDTQRGTEEGVPV